MTGIAFFSIGTPPGQCTALALTQARFGFSDNETIADSAVIAP